MKIYCSKDFNKGDFVEIKTKDGIYKGTVSGYVCKTLDDDLCKNAIGIVLGVNTQITFKDIIHTAIIKQDEE